MEFIKESIGKLSNSNIESNANESRDNDSINSYTIIDNKKLRMEILMEHIYPTYKTEIKTNLFQRKIWARFFSLFSTLTVVLMGASTVVSFSATQFKNTIYISYIAGILGVISLMCKSFSNFCRYQSSTSTHRVNTLLKSIGIQDTIPDTMAELHQNIQQYENDEENANIFKKTFSTNNIIGQQIQPTQPVQSAQLKLSQKI